MSDVVAAFLVRGPRHRERIEINRYADGRVPVAVRVAVDGAAFDAIYLRRRPVKAGYADYHFSHIRPRLEKVEKAPRVKSVPKVRQERPPVIVLERSDGSNRGLNCSCCWDGRACEGLGI